MAGAKLADFALPGPPTGHIAVKEVVFPFARFPGVDTVLGPEMRSTGEVIGLDENFDKARAKSFVASGARLPLQGCVFVSLKDADKEGIVASAEALLTMGFEIIATGGTADFLSGKGLQVRRVNKVLEGRPHIVDALKNGEVQLIFNTTEGAQSVKDSRSIRTTALAQRIPCITTLTGARSAVRAIEAMRAGELQVAPLQSYFRDGAS